jgi:uncharacterized protein
MKKILIYHHSDNDGYLAGTIANLFLSQVSYHEIKFTVGKYDNNEDLKALDWADTIYLLDYSLPMELMRRYVNKLIWIDHHKSAIDNVTVTVEIHTKEPIAGLREIGKSGSLLAWEYFCVSELAEKISWAIKKVPLVVQLVNDRDIWAWEFGEDTAAFHESTRKFMISYTTWEKLLENDRATKKEVQEGYKLLGFVRDIVDTYNESFAWEGMFEGYPAIFLNGSALVSGELHKRLREAHPFVSLAVIFMVKYDKVTFGIYRNNGLKNLDLGRIAMKYGGGGHEGAAGFYTDYKEFIKILKESGSERGYIRK